MLLTTALLLASICQDPTAEAPDHVYRGYLQGPRGIAAELQAGFDSRLIGTEGNDEIVEVFVNRMEQEQLTTLYPSSPFVLTDRGLPFKDLHAGLRGLDPDAGYRTLSEVQNDLQTLANANPAIARRIDLNQRTGKPLSHDGNRIYALKISDNPDLDENEPAILVAANHHARELNTIELAFEVASQLLNGYGTDPQVTQLVNDNTIWIVPTMNPDGLDYVWNSNSNWRKNRRDNGGGNFGVDQNRNYPYFWSLCGSSSSTGSNIYHGPSSASEPETQVMLAFGRAEVFERVWDEHSFGRDVRYAHNQLTVGNIPAPVANILDPIQADIAADMSYAVNSSCCCGGHQHWHFAEYGSLSYLMEMGTGFQPPFAETTTELTRMWPGVERFLYTPVPLEGQVVSINAGQPVVAEIRLPAAPFVDGQKRKSEPRFGRYGVWLAPGTYDLEYSAENFETQTVQITIQAGQTTLQNVFMVPVMAPTVLSSTGAPNFGGTVQFDLSSPDDPVELYYIGCSDSDTPPIPFGPRVAPLADSGVLSSVPFFPSIFQDFVGQFDGAGNATAFLHVPNNPNLVGFTFHFAAVTLVPGWLGGVKGISNGFPLTVQ